MIIATFGPSTAWVGRTTTYQDEQFVLEGHGPIAAQNVLDYARQGHISWPYEWMPGWVESQASSQPQAAPQTKPVAAPLSSVAVGTHATQRRRRLPDWAIVVIALGALVLVGCVALVTAQQSKENERRAALDARRAALVRMGTRMIQIVVWSYANDHNHQYPTADALQAQASAYPNLWPQNPYTGDPMTQGTAPGQYTYTLEPDGSGSTLVGYGRDGPITTLP